MSKKIRAWAATAKGQPLSHFEYDPGPLGAEEVEVAVEHCGLCHSDLSVIDSEWGPAPYPVVPGHEVIGRVVAVGDNAKKLKRGQRVGIGWTASSCMYCGSCLSGDQHLCRSSQSTIIGHYGGFADRVRAHWAWAVPVPDALDGALVGPMLCGGITVFSPFLIHNIRPTARVGVVGIGGLGHMALKFARAWGCEVTAFTSSESKQEEARGLGAHQVISSTNTDAIRKARGSLDLLLVTVNVNMDWVSLMSTLAPHGRLHIVGVVAQPIPVRALDLIGGQRSVSGSPTGSPSAIATMLDFAARHEIAPQVEHFMMSRVNDALDHLRAGKARYRVVLEADFT